MLLHTTTSNEINIARNDSDLTYSYLLAALGRYADFLYSIIDTYARKTNKQDLVMWNTIKQDRVRHLQMLGDSKKRQNKKNQVVINKTDAPADH